MTLNEMTSEKIHISKNLPQSELRKALIQYANADKKWYSYCIVDKNDEYVLSYHYTGNSKYDTLDAIVSVGNIVSAIYDHDRLTPTLKIFSYEQPPIEIMCEVYAPLVKTLARKQQRWWKNIKFNDLVQQCYCTMCELYRNGYYIHKNLLSRAFANDILDYSRRHKVENEIMVSLDTIISGTDDTLLMKDIICDISEVERRQDELDNEADRVMLAEVKRMVIDKIGIERYNELLIDYSSGSKTQGKNTALKYRLKKLISQYKNKLKKEYYGE